MKARFTSSGLYFFDRSSGLNILVEEIKVPPQMWSRAPRHVSIALTNHCDLHCRYCYAPKHNASLDFGKVCDWMMDLDRNGSVGVGFGGGEPTLFKQLVQLCRFASEKTQLAVSFTTHGHHMTDSLLESLTGSVHFIRVSMDGTSGTYELLRGRSFSHLVERLRMIRAIAPFGINFVVNHQTVADLDEAVAVASHCGASQFLLLPEQAAAACSGIDAETRSALLQWVKNYHGAIPLSVSEMGADGMETCNPFAGEPRLLSYAHIDANGILKRSSFETTGVSITGAIMEALDELARIESQRIEKEITA